MALQISKEDTNLLLKDKNVLQESNIDMYRTAGQVTQTALRFAISLINESYHLQKRETPLSIQEICLLTDSFMEHCMKDLFANKVGDKGLAQPTTIDVDEIAQGWAPECDEGNTLESWNKNYKPNEKDEGRCQGVRSAISGYLQTGDLVKVTVGCHIDGYTAYLSHTIVISPTEMNSSSNQVVASGPLLGPKADAVAAAHIAVETVTYLLSCALAPEKLPTAFGERQISGGLIRMVVDTIARSYNCVVVPGSRVRRIRRFLAGQNEGVVAERDIKGVHWTESHQEADLLAAAVETKEIIAKKNSKFANDSAIASDDFTVLPGEVFLIDLKFAPLEGLPRGLVTLQSVDQYSGKSHKQDTLIAKPSIICRDFAKQHVLKLKSSRQLLYKLDNRSVYPTKLSHMAEAFPLDIENADFEAVKRELKSLRFGLAEITNNYLATEKPIQVCKLIPWETILKTVNPTGAHGFDATTPTLPGYELPLPQLGISALRLKALMKEAVSVVVAGEAVTVMLCGADVTTSGKPELLKLNGGSTCKPSWVHSKYELNKDDTTVQGIFQLAELSKDKRFGLSIRETQAWKLKNTASKVAVASDDVSMD